MNEKTEKQKIYRKLKCLLILSSVLFGTEMQSKFIFKRGRKEKKFIVCYGTHCYPFI